MTSSEGLEIDFLSSLSWGCCVLKLVVLSPGKVSLAFMGYEKSSQRLGLRIRETCF